jgi:hypothetical protein
MTVWDLLQAAAWVLSALLAVWLLHDAYRTGRDYDEEFLVHTMEDLGEESQWQHWSDGSGDTGRSPA